MAILDGFRLQATLLRRTLPLFQSEMYATHLRQLKTKNALKIVTEKDTQDAVSVITSEKSEPSIVSTIAETRRQALFKVDQTHSAFSEILCKPAKMSDLKKEQTVESHY